MTIVCATEFTEESAVAVKVAAGLAKKSNQLLLLVHVLSGPLPTRGTELEAAASVALAHDANELAREGITVNVALLHGRLHESVGQFCVHNHASLLVVGDTASSGGVLATTLDKLAYGAEIPMVVVRDPKPFHDWIAGVAPLKVMLALDHSAGSAVARNWVFRLAEYGPLELVGAHIWWPEEEYARRQMRPPPGDETHAGLARTMRIEVGNALSILPANVRHWLHLEMGVGHVDEQLVRLAATEHVDLIILGTHRYRMLGRLTSVSHRVLGQAPMSIACIPELLGLIREAADAQPLSADPEQHPPQGH